MSGLIHSSTPREPTREIDATGLESAPPATSGMIAALVTLLERESGAKNLAIISDRLEAIGPAALPWLDAAAASPDGCAAKEMALAIRRRAFDAAWQRWGSSVDADMETGVALVDRFGDPTGSSETAERALDELAALVGRRLDGVTEASDIIARFNEVLFDECGFRGNADAYDDPENSYLSRVLIRRVGIPVSLSVIVLLVARRLALPIVGIGMPGHFLVRYGSDPAGPYIDPFGGGRVLTRRDCAAWLRASGVAFDSRMLRPVGPRYIVARMLRNLIASFAKRSGASEVEFLTRQLRRVIAVAQDDAETAPSAADAGPG